MFRIFSLLKEIAKSIGNLLLSPRRAKNSDNYREMNKKKADTKNLAIKLRATTLQGEIYIKGQYCYRNIEKLIIE